MIPSGHISRAAGTTWLVAALIALALACAPTLSASAIEPDQPAETPQTLSTQQPDSPADDTSAADAPTHEPTEPQAADEPTNQPPEDPEATLPRNISDPALETTPPAADEPQESDAKPATGENTSSPESPVSEDLFTSGTIALKSTGPSTEQDLLIEETADDATSALPPATPAATQAPPSDLAPAPDAPPASKAPKADAAATDANASETTSEEPTATQPENPKHRATPHSRQKKTPAEPKPHSEHQPKQQHPANTPPLLVPCAFEHTAEQAIHEAPSSPNPNPQPTPTIDSPPRATFPQPNTPFAPAAINANAPRSSTAPPTQTAAALPAPFACPHHARARTLQSSTPGHAQLLHAKPRCRSP